MMQTENKAFRFQTGSMLLAVVFSLCCAACGSSSSATKQAAGANRSVDVDCIKPNMKDMRIRWGEWDDSSSVLDGYEIDAQGRLFKYKASEYSQKYLRDSIGKVDRETLCFYVDTVRKTFIRIQSLTVHAPKMHYIEYQNPEAQLSLRAVWDSRFKTFGSKEFRAIFDSLSTLVSPRHE